MASYIRRAVPVTAHRFDGTSRAALAIAAAFPGRVARPVDREGELMVLCGSRLVRVRPETWVAENEATRILQLWPDDAFEVSHSLAPAGDG